MRIVVAVKILPDSKDLRAGNDGALDFSHARNVVSEYDLNAIEAAAQLAASQEGSTVKVLSVGPASIDESKVKKNILSRGVDELYFATNDALEHADARATAQALSLALQDVGGWDVVICGDGSDDFYAKQVDAQLAATLNVPCVNARLFCRQETAVSWSSACSRMWWRRWRCLCPPSSRCSHRLPFLGLRP